MPDKTVLLRDDFTDPALPGWRVLDGGATNLPAEKGVDAGPPQFGTWELESYWRRQIFTSGHAGGLEITMGKSASGAWESGRIEGEKWYRPEPGQVLRFDFAAILPALPEANRHGYWPALWAMPSVYRYNRQAWPFAGEVDIMEAIGGKPGVAQTLHIGHWGENLRTDGTTFEEPTGIGTGLQGDYWDGREHVYSFEWDRTLPTNAVLRWSIDGVVTQSLIQADFPPLTWWAAFGHEGFYPIINMAMGGSFPDAVGAGVNAQTQPGGVFSVRYVEVSVTGDAIPMIPATPSVVSEPAPPVFGGGYTDGYVAPVVTQPATSEFSELEGKVGRTVLSLRDLLK